MKKMKKVLALTGCAVLLVASSVMGTLAYLTSQSTVNNTFTVGNVSIDLKETPVDKYGSKETGAIKNAEENDYLLIPGKEYTKDPTVTVEANSEKCWLFIEVNNGIEDFEADEAGNDTIEEQITNVNGWTSLDGVDNVYYKQVNKDTNKQTFDVFSTFKIHGYANILANEDKWNAITEENPELVTVSAYAIQYESFSEVGSAWTALQQQIEDVKNYKN